MKTLSIRTAALTVLLSGAMALSACSTEKAIDNTVDVAAGTTRLVAKGAVGAGKLAYRGG
ncbi:hypothetical protein [Roseivivax sp. THAF197b]|uniref:hypothetical protein n=1 Tax=Roseivivax sp. THAF197b TaxID=2588299 RepID=UPI0012687576|nr:hypothetical protein [Roseivivax sp. THAF197b]QFS85158.1 hypothetical protein FIV09_20105 [Roseivivax sp. THAF197b]